MVTSCCISVRSMLPHPVLRHAGGRLAPASQCCPWRCAACRNTPVALTGARGASCREWSERLEARGCRSTLRRMRAAKAARQATGIVATRSPLLQLCFADQKRPSFASSLHLRVCVGSNHSGGDGRDTPVLSRGAHSLAQHFTSAHRRRRAVATPPLPAPANCSRAPALTRGGCERNRSTAAPALGSRDKRASSRSKGNMRTDVRTASRRATLAARSR